MGLSPPKSWPELLEVARRFKEEEGVGRVAIQGDPGAATAVTLFEFVTAGGGNPLTLADEESKRAFEFLTELEPYLASQYVEMSFDTANELLIDDQVYLVMNWTFSVKVVVQDAGRDDIKAYSGWKGPNGESHVLGGEVLAIPNGATHPIEATKLVPFDRYLVKFRETPTSCYSGRLRPQVQSWRSPGDMASKVWILNICFLLWGRSR